MKGKPLVPFGVIAIIGILLMFSLSFVGLSEKLSADEADGEGAEEVVEFEDPITAGEELVNRSCIGCHGGDLQGVGSNPAISDLDGRYSEEEIANIVQKGIGSMPPMPHNQVEADAIATYLLSISE
ncbi:c-type cytochrome [Bacillus sp. FJAT-45350]|uniref:c-type cytochrome n=1 Tax=Bacillus sp. FJAT-45350 TaxID=2011014 RepID=UPI000BB6B6DD|nr:cytochrome c [Bacillus sp. FJAT-45350]